MTRIWAAILTGLLATFVVPATAWAEQSGVADTFRARPRGFFGAFGLLCCLVVVGGIVLAIVLISRGRRRH